MVAVKSALARRRGQDALALLLCAELSVAVFGLPIIAHPASFYIGSGPDPTLMMWALSWWPHAVANHLNPFLTDVVWSPAGFNLAWATTLPGPSLLLSPLSVYAGPVVSYNLLCLLAPALSAWSAYLLCRHITGAFWPSLTGGYIYAFSSYEIGHMLSGQLHLVLIFIPPLAVYLVLKLMSNQLGPRRFVALMALALCAQFLISTEIFATMTVFGAMAMALAGLLLRAPARRRLAAAAGLSAGAYALAALILSPYLYYVFAQGVPGEPIFAPEIFSADLLHPIVPTPLIYLGGRSLAALAASFSGNYWEGGAYVGLPMLALVALFARKSGGRPGGRLLLAALAGVWIASLGPVLHVGGRPTVGLPWKLAAHLPLLDNALPVRFMLYGFLDLAIIVALWASDEALDRRLRWGLAAASLVFLLPSPVYLFSRSVVDTPAFFARSEYKQYLAPGENVVVLPFSATGKSMLWQAQSGMYFRMAGGWLGMTPDEFRHWPILDTFYHGMLVPEYGAQLRAFLAAHRVSMVIAAGHDSARWRRLLATLGVEPLEVGDAMLYRLAPGSLAGYERLTAGEMEARLARANLERFATLLKAADKLLTAGLGPADLSVARAEKSGLLPPGWADPGRRSGRQGAGKAQPLAGQTRQRRAWRRGDGRLLGAEAGAGTLGHGGQGSLLSLSEASERTPKRRRLRAAGARLRPGRPRARGVGGRPRGWSTMSRWPESQARVRDGDRALIRRPLQPTRRSSARLREKPALSTVRRRFRSAS